MRVMMYMKRRRTHIRTVEALMRSSICPLAGTGTLMIKMYVRYQVDLRVPWWQPSVLSPSNLLHVSLHCWRSLTWVSLAPNRLEGSWTLLLQSQISLWLPTTIHKAVLTVTRNENSFVIVFFIHPTTKLMTIMSNVSKQWYTPRAIYIDSFHHIF